MTADDALRDMARAVLYEGYVLWPYRRDTLKNQKRWTFGAVLPCDWVAHGHEDDRCTMHAECLLIPTGQPVEVSVTVRFLQVIERRIARVGANDLEFVDSLTINGQHYLAWDEAIEREVRLPVVAESGEAGAAVSVPANTETEWIDLDGSRAGAVVRGWRSLSGLATAVLHPVGNTDLFRVSATVQNNSACDAQDRDNALRQAFVSTHMVLHAHNADFISLTDPPDEYASSAAECRNEGCWPVLVGDAPSRDTVLAAPVILQDYPRIAPESPGDLFDGGEIDELLMLNILGLTDEEKAAMRAADARTREILERTESLSAEGMLRLHGTFRSVAPRD